MRRSRGDAVIGGGSPPASPGCLPGLCSNIWFWRCTTGILAVVAVLILCIHLAVNCSSAKGSSGCPPPEPCPADWLYHQGKCYYFSEKEKDWNSSQSFCSSHNSSLTVIESQQELKFIMKITRQDPWIGLRKTGEEFHWKSVCREKSVCMHSSNPATEMSTSMKRLNRAGGTRATPGTHSSAT
ncbi:C-type lectin domain family 2 member L isoform X2 [Dermochelys coriacea]|uniref:C-type lectin domain family 2 member L isoform X2 n=1 Tax=Dermochelys coriacea TaxID=27794 RepID=UPI001CA9BD5A|nr:C-type lectin domain family 2 member L isoform X2 [Dermochelys coriacea]